MKSEVKPCTSNSSQHNRGHPGGLTHDSIQRNVCAWPAQVETAVIQSFDKALTEEDWQAFHREKEAEKEAALRAEEEQLASEQAAAAAAAAEAERLAAEIRRKEELAKVGCAERDHDHLLYASSVHHCERVCWFRCHALHVYDETPFSPG